MVPSAVRSSKTFRRLLAGLVVFGVVVVLDLVLFGWLIFRSLSQREIERVLLETREEAEDIAGRIAERAGREGADLYTVMAVERETRTYIDSVLRQRGILSRVTVHDATGALVYEATGQVTRPVDPDGPERAEPAGEGTPLPDLDVGEIPPDGGRVYTEEEVRTSEYQVEEPIGEFGVLRIGIDQGDLQERIGDLRRDLLGQAATLGAVTTFLLVAAFLLIVALLRRGYRLEEQAAESERMAYIGTLASGLAHEIRNPLNSLNLNMQMLEEEMGTEGGGPSGGRLLSITRREIARLERLVTDFLAYARPRALDVEEVSVADLLEQVRELLEREAHARRVGLAVADRTGGGRLRVDPGQIRQLLLNLAQNALTAAEEAAAEPRVVLSAERRGSWIDLLVEDNGAGIPPEEREKIFDIFYSTRKGGTGLGLAIVDRIARNHSGRVEVDSEPGQGTTVRVALPAEGPRTPRTPQEGAGAPPARRPRRPGEGSKPRPAPPPDPTRLRKVTSRPTR